MKKLLPSPPRLLIRPTHAEHESLRGYISRASSQNGSSPILNAMLTSLEATTNGIHEIATLTGCSDSTLKRHGSYSRNANSERTGVLFGCSIISSENVWVGRRVICPKCLSDSDISIVYWEIKDYDVCHVHGCYLINRCDNCGRALLWEYTIAGKCSCGVHLVDIKVEMASITRRLICKLISDAVADSILRGCRSEIISTSSGPLNWLFIISNFILSVIIPFFCQEHLGKICAIANEIKEELLLAMLNDREYYNQLRRFIPLHSFNSQMTMAASTRAGIFDNEMRNSFLPCYKNAPLHQHLFKIKYDVLHTRESNLRRTLRYVNQAETRKREFGRHS